MIVERTRAFWWVAVLVAACGSDSPPSNPGGSCEPGETRVCVGVGACQGGQLCTAEAEWSECQCSADDGVDGSPTEDSGVTEDASATEDGSAGDDAGGNEDAGGDDADAGPPDTGCGPLGEIRECPAPHCNAIPSVDPQKTYFVKPNEVVFTFQVRCDGEWALIYSANPSQPGCVKEAEPVWGDPVLPASQTYLPLQFMISLAQVSEEVRIRQGNAPDKYIQSAPGNSIPIVNLRMSNAPSSNDGWKDWIISSALAATVGSPPSEILQSNGGSIGWPNVFWASGNTKGIHIISNAGGSGCANTWVFGQPSVPIEVHIK